MDFKYVYMYDGIFILQNITELYVMERREKTKLIQANTVVSSKVLKKRN